METEREKKRKKKRKKKNTSSHPSYILTSHDVLKKGLEYLNNPVTSRANGTTRITKFKKHYGSDPYVLSNLWFDLQTTELEAAQLKPKEISEHGFRMFMIAQNWLWDYPRNAEVFGSRFHQCERNSRGSRLWYWIKKIAALRPEKIVWEEFEELNGEPIFVVTIDGTDFRDLERSTEYVNIDRKKYSKKFAHGARKYEIAISLKTGLCVWINGPYIGGENDKNMFVKGGIAQKLKPGQMAITDRGYKGLKCCSLTNLRESKDAFVFKGRARARHETFNGRLKFFGVLGLTYRHDFDKHGIVFNAVCVIVQTQLMNGCPLFEL